jgi:hypothetical protein
MTAVHKNKVLLNWRHTLVRALRSFRAAILRRAHDMHRMFVQRRYSPLEGITPTAERERFPHLIFIQVTGESTLDPDFVAAIKAAESDLEQFNTRPPPPPPPSYYTPRQLTRPVRAPLLGGARVSK